MRELKWYFQMANRDDDTWHVVDWRNKPVIDLPMKKSDALRLRLLHNRLVTQAVKKAA